jgi:hypothetical protein
MARRTFEARGEKVRLVLPPSDGARLGRITFDDWLADGAV